MTPQRRSTPCSRCSPAATAPMTPPSAPTSGAGPRSTTVTARSLSRQAEATSEPVNPAPMTSTRRGLLASRWLRPAASSRVRSTNTPSSAASALLGHGRARVPVAISSRSNSMMALPSPRRTCLPAIVERGRGDAEQPLRVDVTGQLGMVGRYQSLKDSLGQGRAVVGLILLIADDGYRAGEAVTAHDGRRRHAGQRGAHDHDAAAAAEVLDGGGDDARRSPLRWHGCRQGGRCARLWAGLWG